MVRTTPVSRSLEHKVWHVFNRGGCHGCGFYCDDCPNDVATCKCKPGKENAELIADLRLQQENNGLTDSWTD